MKRHITDHPRPADSKIRTREYVKIEREEGRHPQTEALHERPHARSGLARVLQFLRIDRGRRT